jgi:hypothetical protein
MTLGHDTSVRVKDRYFIWAVPCTVLTPYTARVIMPDDAVIQFNVGVGRTAFETLRIDAVVTAHRVEELQGIRELTHLHLTHTSPFDLIRVGILFITGYFTTVTPYTGSGIEVKTVLLSLFELWNVNTVIPALHTCFIFMIYEAL